MESLVTLVITGTKCIKNRQTDQQTNKHCSLYIFRYTKQNSGFWETQNKGFRNDLRNPSSIKKPGNPFRGVRYATCRHLTSLTIFLFFIYLSIVSLSIYITSDARLRTRSALSLISDIWKLSKLQQSA
jgi:hypothetical protein